MRVETGVSWQIMSSCFLIAVEEVFKQARCDIRMAQRAGQVQDGKPRYQDSCTIYVRPEPDESQDTNMNKNCDAQTF